MKHVVLGIWDDLRAKRLWPVAVALVVAMIAIPVFVMKPAEDAPEVRPAARSAQTTPAVAVAKDGPRASSDLGVFGKKDPFRPPAAALKPSTSGQTASPGATAGPSAPPPAALDSGSPGSGSPAVSSGGSGASGSTGTAPSAPTVRRRPSIAYTYVIDVDFGPKDKVRRRRGLARLRVLPSERNPVAVFLGVPAGGKRAVFLLNPALRQGGQGTCRPSRTRCTFLHLSTDPAKNGHHVVGADGTTYVLRLKAIRRVTVREASRASRRGPRASAGARRGSGSVLFIDEHR